MTDLALNLDPIESPCIDVCRLDDQGRCVGCFRSAQEIGDWLSMDPQQRKTIMQALPARAGRLFDPE
ncbi:MAG: DUF1289 domain-containing protein [Wenzhouxiangellaceae bacterium]|nr:DUF1289 domain-containing protein [Wenzhouxiangellaceae bacterium]